ncbi:hypothetical protein ANO11243_001490 [Dothideomycetidae sp. 11243]|nr:hypothetical protein ANO11243_001490 [fungal sp. No.11243]
MAPYPPTGKRAQQVQPPDPILPPHTDNLKSISLLFLGWKILLLGVVAASPGPGYDTSTELLLSDLRSAITRPDSAIHHVIHHVLSRLLRWDAFYFVNIGSRGYLFEQEWAFSRFSTFPVSALAKVLPNSLFPSLLLRQTLAATAVSHLAHFGSCLLIYALALRLLPDGFRNRTAIATLAAYLHILSPAGVFLSAPYAEALFSCLNFLGFYLLSFAAESPRSARDSVTYSLSAVGGGLSFAVASTFRGNGLLSVLAFGVYALPIARRVLSGIVSLNDLSALPGLVVGVVLTVFGFATPQYIAYTEYCTGAALNSRPWCTKVPPSIYTFVQAHYWNVGFLKYWTVSNVPLFLIAAPSLVILFATAVIALYPLVSSLWKSSETPQRHLLVCAATAAPQLALVVAATTSFHVQIINRICSGYPTWYVMLASAIVGRQQQAGEGDGQDVSVLQSPRLQRRVVKCMMLYGLIQAGLYASFLPPA